MRKMLFSVWVVADLELSRGHFIVSNERLRLISHIEEFTREELIDLYPKFEATLEISIP